MVTSPRRLSLALAVALVLSLATSGRTRGGLIIHFLFFRLGLLAVFCEAILLGSFRTTSAGTPILRNVLGARGRARRVYKVGLFVVGEVFFYVLMPQLPTSQKDMVQIPVLLSFL